MFKIEKNKNILIIFYIDYFSQIDTNGRNKIFIFYLDKFFHKLLNYVHFP